MQTVLLSMPIKNGKMDAYKAFAKEITGPRKEEYLDMLRRYGLKSARVWHQRLSNRDYVFVFHEMEEDAGERLAKWSSSEHAFDKWFNNEMLNFYDIESFEKLPKQPEFLYEIKASTT